MIERSDIEKLSAISRFADSRVSRTADWLAYQEAFQNAWPSLKSYVTSYCSRTMNWLTFSSAPDLEFCRLSRSFQSFVSSCQRKPAVWAGPRDQNNFSFQSSATGLANTEPGTALLCARKYPLPLISPLRSRPVFSHTTKVTFCRCLFKSGFLGGSTFFRPLC